MTARTRGRARLPAVTGVLMLALACSCAGRRAEGAASALPHAAATAPAGPTTTAAPPTASTAPEPPNSSSLAPASSARWDNLRPAHDPRRTPVRLVIESLGVVAPIASMGIDADGALDLPADNTTVAWFADGSSPGNPGATLLAAHVDHDGRAGVFFDLRNAEIGTAMRVELADGTALTFVVDAPPSNVKKSALPTEQVFRTDGPSTLVLVTCGGRFDRAARSYEENTIVTARAAP